MFKHILVPVDGSETSAAGLDKAIELALDQKATLHLLHVVDETVLTQSVIAGGYMSQEVLESFIAGGRSILDAAAARVRLRGVAVDPILVEDIAETVADVIVSQARKVSADLIVIGTHGRRGVRRLVLGSDAEGVVRLADAPVMLVRQPEAASA
jgi:nucleotide-binding universal stress UspA family protein